MNTYIKIKFTLPEDNDGAGIVPNVNGNYRKVKIAGKTLELSWSVNISEETFNRDVFLVCSLNNATIQSVTLNKI